MGSGERQVATLSPAYQWRDECQQRTWEVTERDMADTPGR